MNVATAEPQQESWPSSRGVLASWGRMTPPREFRSSDDVSKFKLTIRDVLLLLMGCVAMYGAQLGAQYGMRSDIRDLKTSFDASMKQQVEMNAHLQYQIDETRRASASNQIRAEELGKAVAELRGILMGAGIKGVQK